MVITRTPFRISFFGGGTDYPAWFEGHGGAVLSTTIDKYCHISCRYLPQFFDHRSRVAYSKIELVKSHDEIEHPVVRAGLNFLGENEGVEINNFDDLPARSGMGSSSSFTVGFLHALRVLRGEKPSKEQLALDAIHLEQSMLKENVGCQDQAAAAFGGLNKILFGGPEKIRIEPVVLSDARRSLFQDHLLLFFTGRSRYASDIVVEQIQKIPERARELKRMLEIVDEAVAILKSGDLNDFGRLLDESWKIKKGLSSRITTDYVDETYKAAKEAGALGGKLLGAGGGGFMLFFVSPEKREAVKSGLSKLLNVPFRLESQGSHVIYHDSETNVRFA